MRTSWLLLACARALQPSSITRRQFRLQAALAEPVAAEAAPEEAAPVARPAVDGAKLSSACGIDYAPLVRRGVESEA